MSLSTYVRCPACQRWPLLLDHGKLPRHDTFENATYPVMECRGSGESPADIVAKVAAWVMAGD